MESDRFPRGILVRRQRCVVQAAEEVSSSPLLLLGLEIWSTVRYCLQHCYLVLQNLSPKLMQPGEREQKLFGGGIP